MKTLITNKNKIHGLVNVIFNKHEYEGPFCEGCGLCSSSCNRTSSENINVYKSINFDTDNSDFTFKNIKFLATKITGNASLKVKNDTFNHASCQCSVYYDLIDTTEEYLNINFKIDFIIQKNKITLDYVPEIVI